MPQVQDNLLDSLTCSPVRYHYATTAPTNEMNFFNESYPGCRIDRLTCWPAIQQAFAEKYESDSCKQWIGRCSLVSRAEIKTSFSCSWLLICSKSYGLRPSLITEWISGPMKLHRLSKHVIVAWFRSAEFIDEYMYKKKPPKKPGWCNIRISVIFSVCFYMDYCKT